MRSTSSPRAVSNSTGKPRSRANPAQHFESIDARQHHIEHGQQVLARVAFFRPLSPSCTHSVVKPSARKILAHQVAELHIVVDNQNSFHGSSSFCINSRQVRSKELSNPGIR